MILPQTTVLLSSPYHCKQLQYWQFPAGVGVGPTGDYLIPESSLLEWTSHNSKGQKILYEQLPTSRNSSAEQLTKLFH
jgi:hypothetical protein